jgi:allophanate hydrolase subunit 2
MRSPSGGYPKFGTVIEADLWRLGQAPIGSRVRFVETTWDDAGAALDEDPPLARRERGGCRLTRGARR